MFERRGRAADGGRGGRMSEREVGLELLSQRNFDLFHSVAALRHFPFALVLLDCLVVKKYFCTFLCRLQTNVLSGSCHDFNSQCYVPFRFFVFVPLLN